MTRGRLSSRNRTPRWFMVFRFTELSQQEKISRQIKLYLGVKVALTSTCTVGLYDVYNMFWVFSLPVCKPATVLSMTSR